MGLTRLAIYRPLAILMLILGLILMGAMAFTRLKVDRLPPLSFPFVSVNVSYPGASPEDVETQVLETVEEALAGVQGLSSMSSTAREGGGGVNLQFAEGTDTDKAAVDVERRMAGIRNQLPRDAGAPSVRKFDPNASSIMNIALTGARQDELYAIASEVLQPQLLSVPGVADVDLSGGVQREVRVTLDPARLEAYGVSVEQVQQALTRENVNAPVGLVDQGRSTMTVRAVGLFQTLNDLNSLIIVTKPTGTVYLRNVARVEQRDKPSTRVQRYNGQEAVGLSIVKQADANTIEVAENIETTLEKLHTALPEGAHIVVTNDSARFVRRSLEAVQKDLLVAVFLTATVLLLFLHSWRNTLIVVLAIPTSLISTFLVMYFAGFSLNLMTLMALAMTIGILVDDSIVVLENIHRHLALGEQPFGAALRGRSEIGLAAMAITFTDVIVYLPVAFTAGNIGQLFIQYGLTIVAATLFSLFVSFTLTPMLASRWLKAGDSEEHIGGGPLAPVYRVWEALFSMIGRGYGHTLGWSLHHRPVIVMVGMAALGAALAFLPLKLLSTEYAPSEDDGQFSVSVQMAPNATVMATDEATLQMEAMLRDIPEIRSIFTSVGGGGRNSSNIAVELTDRNQRQRGVQDIMAEVRQLGRSIPEVSVRASASAALGGGGGFMSVLILGDDLATLTAIAAQVQEVAKSVPGIADATSSAQARTEENRFIINRERAAALGVSSQQVGATLRTLVQGSAVSRFQPDGEPAQDITLIGPAVAGARDLASIPIVSSRSGLVRVSQVTTLRPSSSPVQISRTERKRSLSVSTTIAGRPLGDVAADLRASLQGLQLPPGYRVDVRGSAQQLDQALAALTAALALSVVLVYMLLWRSMSRGCTRWRSCLRCRCRW